MGYLTRFNVAAAAVKKPDERLLHMAIVMGVNKRTNFSLDLTKKKTHNLDDLFFRAEQFMRLETGDAELALMA